MARMNLKDETHTDAMQSGAWERQEQDTPRLHKLHRRNEGRCGLVHHRPRHPSGRHTTEQPHLPQCKDIGPSSKGSEGWRTTLEEVRTSWCRSGGWRLTCLPRQMLQVSLQPWRRTRVTKVDTGGLFTKKKGDSVVTAARRYAALQ